MPCYNKYGERVAIEQAKTVSISGRKCLSAEETAWLTQFELAAYIGCNQKYISQIETGAAKASVSICYKIANTFSVSVDSLFTDPEKCVNAGENTSDREFAESITRTIIQYLDTKK